MTQIMGYEGRVEYVEESSYGTPPYTSTLCWIGDVRKFEVNVKTEKAPRFRMRPRGATNRRQAAGTRSGKTTMTCKLEWAPQATNTSADMTYMSFVAMCLGTSTGIGDARKSITLNAVNKEDTVEGPFTGAVCKSFSVKTSVGEDVIMNAEFEAKEYDPSAPLVVTSDLSAASNAFEQAEQSDGEVLDFDDVSLSISGTQIDGMTDMELKVDNRAEGRPRIGNNGKPNEVVLKPAVITGRVTLDLEDNTELLRMTNKDSFTMVLTIGAFAWTLTGCHWSDAAMMQDTESPVQIPLSFTAETLAIA